MVCLCNDYTIQQSLPAVNLSLVGAIGFKGERPGNTTEPPNFPLCQIDGGSAKPVTWKLCRDQAPSLINITNTPLVAENWGAKWKVYAITGLIIENPTPFQIYNKLSWHGGGAGAPILRIQKSQSYQPMAYFYLEDGAPLY